MNFESSGVVQSPKALHPSDAHCTSVHFDSHVTRGHYPEHELIVGRFISKLYLYFQRNFVQNFGANSVVTCS